MAAVFGVCTLRNVVGKREDKRMLPIRYHSEVVGVVTYEKAILSQISEAQELGQLSWEKVAANSKARRSV